LGTTKQLLYISFEEIRSINDSDEIVDKIRNELLSFVAKEYRNNFYYFINGEFCKVTDMRDTMVGKYMLLPLKIKKV
jgi:hypothetical protein